jgi:hypothetical protein
MTISKIYHTLFLFFITSSIIYLIFQFGDLTERSCFIILTLLLLTLLIFQISIVKKTHNIFWLLNPIIISSVFTFLLSYGVSNILFFLNPDELDLLNLVPDISPAMVKISYLTNISVIAIFAGYWSPLYYRIIHTRIALKFDNKILSKYTQLKWYTIPTFYFISSLSRIIQVRLGIFGYFSSIERRIELGSYSQYLALGSSLGKVGLFLYSLNYFKNNSSKRNKYYFFLLLAYDLLWGVLSGFKSEIVIPFVILFISYYVSTGKTSYKWIVYSVISLFFAYVVIEPFRATKNFDSNLEARSVNQFASLLRESRNLDLDVSENKVPILLALASRTNLTWIGSQGIDYADNVGLKDSDPDFLSNLFLSPLHAFIPRILWSGKPLSELGIWYTQVVMGKDSNSSTAMGPLTYLYFAGGQLLIFIFFFFIGCLQRIVLFLLRPFHYFAGLFLYLLILMNISIIDSSINSILISLFRDIPISLLLVLLFFKKEKIK